MRRLIVNADDFGLTAGVNRAIIESHTHGIVTSCTLMATGPAFEDAVGLANSGPRLSVGCHALLIDGQSILDASRIPSLTTRHPGPTRFRDGLKSFAAHALTGRLDMHEIEAEVTEQIRKIQSSGITVTHIDSHKHTHMFPAVLRPLLLAARACGVRAIRNPFGPRRPLGSTELLARPGLWTRYAEVRILRALAGRFRETVARHGMITPDGTLGIVVTGSLDESLFRAIAAIIPEGTWEFVCHPGYNDADLQRTTTRLRGSREAELRVLTMPAAKTLLEEHGISLISYRELISENVRG